jgi:hypothetical protein
MYNFENYIKYKGVKVKIRVMIGIQTSLLLYQSYYIIITKFNYKISGIIMSLTIELFQKN